MRALGVLCVLLALGWGLRAVTHPPAEEDIITAGKTPSGSDAAAARKVSVPVQVTFSAPAKKAELRHLGNVVWSAEAPPTTQKLVLQMPFPPEGIELAARVEWVGSGLGAVRVQLTAPDGTELDRTAWGEAVLETILPFP